MIMRMWMQNPQWMCRKHLLGEHGELHKHRPSFVKKYNIFGRIFPIAQIEPMSMKTRHDELMEEMIRRGFNHKSPYELPDLNYLSTELLFAKVDMDYSKNDLLHRCPECKKLYEEFFNKEHQDGILENS